MPRTTIPDADLRSDVRPGRGRVAAPPDWRGLLDLLEDRTGKKYDDLWRAWVVRHGRSQPARRTVGRPPPVRRSRGSRAGEWQLPPIVPQAMRAWQFDQATELLDAADGALDDRDDVGDGAADAGLSGPANARGRVRGRLRVRCGGRRGRRGADDDRRLRPGRADARLAIPGSSSRSGCGAPRRRPTSRGGRGRIRGGRPAGLRRGQRGCPCRLGRRGRPRPEPAHDDPRGDARPPSSSSASS